MKQLGKERGGYHTFWWYLINDNRRSIARGMEAKGSILREGRFYLNYYGYHALKLSWNLLGGTVLGGWKDWLSADAEIRLSYEEDPGITLHLSLSRLIAVWITIGLPRRWLTSWMLSDRTFGIKLGYIGDIAWITFAHAQWAEDCGMTDYYRRQNPRTHTDLQLWPGWELKIKWPPVLDWVLGRAKHHKTDVQSTYVKIPLDNKEYDGKLTIEQRYFKRPRWPWAYRRAYTSYLEVKSPPRFAGKGESSWDCGDDAIYGFGTNELRPASVVGLYVKRVLENRERYGMPSEKVDA